nr:MAG TPA: Avd-like-generating retroelement protein [Caudoviricetes sp.]
MSNVHRRFRKETELQFLMTAQELQFELTKFVMREKNIPKKWRLIIGQPLIAKVDELLDNLNYANTIFPTNIYEYEMRSKYQTLAVCNCWQLHNKIVRMIECVQSVKIENLEKIAELLTNAEVLIKKWKKTDKERFKKLLADGEDKPESE